MRFNEEIVALTVDPHQSVRRAHDPFHAIDGRKAGPLQNPDSIENGLSIENPSAGLVSLAAVQVTTPALVLRQAQGCQTLLNRMAVRMIRTGRQLGEVQTRQVKQGAINIPWVVCTRVRLPPKCCHHASSAAWLSGVARSSLLATITSAEAS